MLISFATRFCFCLAVVMVVGSTEAVAEPALVRSAKSGVWSAKETWEKGRVPKAGDRVVIRSGHHVGYDVASEDVIRLVQIAGTLEFARDRTTKLEAGLIAITSDEEPSEEGFDCHAAMQEMKGMTESDRPALLVGRPGFPIPAEFSATIRLHYIDGMDRLSCPAVVCCGGRMEFHGASLPKTWLKIRQTADAGDFRLRRRMGRGLEAGRSDHRHQHSPPA